MGVVVSVQAQLPGQRAAELGDGREADSDWAEAESDVLVNVARPRLQDKLLERSNNAGLELGK